MAEVAAKFMETADRWQLVMFDLTHGRLDKRVLADIYCSEVELRKLYLGLVKSGGAYEKILKGWKTIMSGLIVHWSL